MQNTLNLYVVIDTKAGALIGPIIHDRSPVPIIRQITEAVNKTDAQGKPDGLIARNPDDFSIYHIGEIDESIGLVDGFNEPVLITTALALKAKPE